MNKQPTTIRTYLFRGAFLLSLLFVIVIPLALGQQQLNNWPLAPSGCVPPPGIPPSPGLAMVAWYPFDETSGSIAFDITGFANNGTLINGPLRVPGEVAGALNFNGINNYVEAPDAPQINFGDATSPGGNFSIDAWIRVDPSASGYTKIIVDKRKEPMGLISGYSLYVGSYSRLQLQLGDRAGVSTYTTPSFHPALTDGNWHHVAVTVRRNDPQGIKWYHNGHLVWVHDPTDRPGSLKNNSPLRIGTRTTGPPLTGWFYGDIDEVEIFRGVLPARQVRAIYAAGPFGKCKP
jgi:Concanavalin A-like lectin/glucanases superfamily